MEVLGVSEAARRIIKSYLNGRRTMCSVGKFTSESIPLFTGVGEGSVVGPLFFITCLADVSVTAIRVVRRLKLRNINVEIYLIEYADDVSSLIIGDNDDDIQEAVTEMSAEFSTYFKSAGFSMNPEKSEVILFRTSPQKQTRVVHVGDQPESEHVKLLGVTVEKGYRFKKHARNVAKAVNYKVSRMSKIFDSLGKKEGKQILESLTLSSINYLLEVYGNKKGVQSIVQKSLNNAVRLLCGGGKRDDVGQMLTSSGWLNLTNMYRLALITSLRRLLDTNKPPVCAQLLNEGQRYLRHEHNLRYKGIPIGWFPQASSSRECFLLQAIEESNKHRIPHKHWGDMEKSEIRAEISKILATSNYNGNL